MPATTFHLIRHATYDLLDRGILAGRTTGWGLNDAGRAQAAQLADSLRPVPLAAVIASPLQRAQETAAALAGERELDVETDPAFNEVDFGAWSNTAFSAVRNDPRWATFNRFRSMTAPPGGETMLHVQARAVEGLRALAVRFPAAGIAIVTHGDVVKAVLAHALGMPLDLFHRLDIAPAARSTVVLGEGYLRVLGVNLPPATNRQG